MTEIIDHTKKNFQNGRFPVNEIEFIEQGTGEFPDYQINCRNEEIHIFRCSCVLMFEIEDGITYLRVK